MQRYLLKKVLVFTVIAYLTTWFVAFIIAFQFQKEGLSNEQINLYHSIAALGPSIAAIITTYIFYGRKGVKALLLKINFFIRSIKTYFLIFSPMLFFTLGILIYAITKSEWYDFKEFAFNNWYSFKIFIFWLLPLLSYSIFEEIGWRGFLLPHLQEKYNAWKSTIILTVIWALWHIPFFFYRFNFSIAIGIGFFLGIFVGAIILTSIYNSVRGFLVPVMLFHFFNNLFSSFDKEMIVAVISMGFVFVAVVIYKKYGKENLSQLERVKNYFLLDFNSKNGMNKQPHNNSYKALGNK